MSRIPKSLWLPTAGIAALIVGACGGSHAASAHTLSFTQRDLGLTVDHTTVAAGDVQVTVNNTGKIEHELVAFRTDLAADNLPSDAEEAGRVAEDGAGVTHIDPEAENVAPGTSKTVTMHLDAGQYVFICNLPGHYMGGMRVAVTVH